MTFNQDFITFKVDIISTKKCMVVTVVIIMFKVPPKCNVTFGHSLFICFQLYSSDVIWPLSSGLLTRSCSNKHAQL